MKSVYHQNESRGLADHGWLKSRHTFCFAGYHNQERMSFGLLRGITLPLGLSGRSEKKSIGS